MRPWFRQAARRLAYAAAGALAFLVLVLDLGAETPPWWNPSYACREPITVSAGSAAVPTSYSVAITFNHASMVTAGEALAGQPALEARLVEALIPLER